MAVEPAKHVFFFSYAHANRCDPHLTKFFEDLCTEVAVHTKWEPGSQRVSFRDGNNLPLMQSWRPALLDALQSAAVLVCVTTPAFFQSGFCGKEYFLFDQQRQTGLTAGQKPPAVILPVIWVPVRNGLPAAMDQVQWQDGSMPDIYEKKGLRYLKVLEPAEYERCVLAFAEAIADAWRGRPSWERQSNVSRFEDIPNPFAEGRWVEAAGPQGWLPGPGVANFVYAAGLKAELPAPSGRYGANASEWRPYFPPGQTTIGDLVYGITSKQSLRYREIPIDDDLEGELTAARERKNLTILVADPQTLRMPAYQSITTFDGNPWEGTAMMVPWDGTLGPWEDSIQHVSTLFPIRSGGKAPPFRAPIADMPSFEQALDITLTELRAAVTRVEAEKKDKSDAPPSQVVGPS
jgi:FxsC-like protein